MYWIFGLYLHRPVWWYYERYCCQVSFKQYVKPNYLLSTWRFGTTADALCASNGISNCNQISIGQVLNVPCSSSSSSSGSSSSGTSGSAPPSSGWPNGPLKAICIYHFRCSWSRIWLPGDIDIGVNWNDPASTFKSICDTGYNLILVSLLKVVPNTDTDVVCL